MFVKIAYRLIVILFVLLLLPSRVAGQHYCLDMAVKASHSQDYSLFLKVGPTGPGVGYPNSARPEYVKIILEMDEGMSVIGMDTDTWIVIPFDYDLVVDGQTITLTANFVDDRWLWSSTGLCHLQFDTFGTVSLKRVEAPCYGFPLNPLSNLWDGETFSITFDPVWVSCYPSEEDYLSGDNCHFALDGSCDGYTVYDGYDCPLGACSRFAPTIQEQVCEQRIEVACLADHGIWLGAGTTDCVAELGAVEINARDLSATSSESSIQEVLQHKLEVDDFQE